MAGSSGRVWSTCWASSQESAAAFGSSFKTLHKKGDEKGPSHLERSYSLLISGSKKSRA